jgi:fatty acid desaturase
MEPKHEPPDPTPVKAGEPPLGASHDAKAPENHRRYAVNATRNFAIFLALLLAFFAMVVTIMGGCWILWFAYSMGKAFENFKGH